MSGLQLGAWDNITEANDEGLCNCVALLLGPQTLDPCETENTASDNITDEVENLLDIPTDIITEVL